MNHSKDFFKVVSLPATTTALALFIHHQQNDDKFHDFQTFLCGSSNSRPNKLDSSYYPQLNISRNINQYDIETSLGLHHNLFSKVTLCDPKSSHNDSHLINNTGIEIQNKNNIVNKNKEINPMSRTQAILYKLSILNDQTLPTPRLLSPNDPIFTYTKLKRGLKQRERDERKLRNMQSEIASLMEKNKNNKRQEEKMNVMTGIMEKISEIAYGKGITPQMREDFLIKYGCTAYSTSILDTIIQYTANHGIIEIGAGNGQWAKAISDHHQTLLKSNNDNNPSIPPSPLQQFIVAYDDMSHIPLNTQVYHKYTQPAQDFFFPNVQKMKGQDAVGLIKNRGRVLLLVYPPPGKMAIDVVKQYTKFDGNDTIIYVGEGVGGANADQEFFDYFLNKNSVSEEGKEGDKYRWYVMETLDIEDVLGGGKGFERMFVLQRFKVG